MAYSFGQLKHKTIAELREIAKGLQHEAVQGWSQMNKDHLLPALCQALGIDMHVHHEVVGLDKAGLKARMRALKADRDNAIETGDHERLKALRRQRHRLNRRIRAALV
jgi:DNA-binding IclR family transcriptional regulator